MSFSQIFLFLLLLLTLRLFVSGSKEVVNSAPRGEFLIPTHDPYPPFKLSPPGPGIHGN